MFSSIFKKIFGSRNDRLLKQYQKRIAEINAFEAPLAALSDEALQAKTQSFKQALKDGTPLNDFLP